jgi:hypothetical protein
MTLVELFSKNDCHLCFEARIVIERVQKRIPFALREFKLLPGDPDFEEYKEIVPVVLINKVQAFKYRVSENMLKIKLQQAAGEGRTHDVDPDEPAIEKK